MIFKVVMPFITRFIGVFLLKWLLSHDITNVGALQSYRRVIPIELKNAAKREFYSHLRFWEEEQKKKKRKK